MYNLTHLHAGYLNYQLVHKKALARKNNRLSIILNLAIAFLVVIFCAQLLSAWRFEADAKELIGQFFLPVAYAAEIIPSAEVTPYTTNLVMKAGQVTSVDLTFINNGSIVWPAGQVTLETGPFLKTFSQVQHQSWSSFFKVLTLSKAVKPGEKIIINFKIAGPKADLVGVIQENFQLVYNQQPIKGSLARVFIDSNQTSSIFVANSTNVQPIVQATTPVVNPQSVQYIIGYNKLGQKVQVIKGQYVPGVSLTKPSVAAIAAEQARLAAATVTIDNKLDSKPISSDDNQIFCIALSVTERAISPRCQTNNNEAQSEPGWVNYSRKLIQEPLIRVGLFASDQVQRITSNQPFSIYAADNLLVRDVSANTIVMVSYIKSASQYQVIIGDQIYQTSNYLRFISQSGNDGIFQLPDYRNNPSRNANLNDNKFRNSLEYRYTPKTDQVWWINELLVDSYLKGLAETSNASPVEFQKVLVTAARTYVLYHYYRGLDFKLAGASTKHAGEYFHVDATYDQVYRGYNSEIRLPRLAQAIQETRGLIVTHNNVLAVTPYFSRSDGRTRSWNEVWGGGDKPWLRSVVVPQDSGKTLFGHGVGMSAQGALLMIVDNNQSWSEVLAYFYQGTTLQQAY